MTSTYLRVLGVCLAFFTGAFSAGAPAADPGAPVLVYKSNNDFDYTKENVEMAITDRGMLISGTLHVSDMLNRTGKDLGFPNNVYAKAESIEFCSALISHRMTSTNPGNLVICPFTIAVYIRTDEPEQVYVAFRRPYLAGDSADVSTAVFELLDGIVRESIE